MEQPIGGGRTPQRPEPIRRRHLVVPASSLFRCPLPPPPPSPLIRLIPLASVIDGWHARFPLGRQHFVPLWKSRTFSELFFLWPFHGRETNDNRALHFKSSAVCIATPFAVAVQKGKSEFGGSTARCATIGVLRVGRTRCVPPAGLVDWKEN